jgi:glycosyltransferase involved in cell wall biosynthesis
LKSRRRKRKAADVAQRLSKSAGTVLLADSYKSLELLSVPNVHVICLAHGSEFPAAPSLRKEQRIKDAIAKATLVLANSGFTLDEAGRYMHADQLRHVFHPPIEPPAPIDDSILTRLRSRLGAGPIIAGVARLEPRKGFDHVISALVSLTEAHPNVSFAIAGSGSDEARLRALAQSLGVEQRVHFLGRVGDAERAALLSLADIYAMPSRREGNSVEGFGIAYIEAAALCTALIGGIDGGAADAIVDGVTGLLVDGNDVSAVMQALDRMLSDDELRTRLADAAERDAQTRFWPEQVIRFWEIVEDA